MKGLIGIVMVAIIISLISLGIISFSFSSTSTYMATTAKESKILRSIDKIEMIKRGVPYALKYGFYQGVYEVAKNGGYCENSGNYVWRSYDSLNIPPYLNEIKECTNKTFKKYVGLSDGFYNFDYTFIQGLYLIRAEVKQIGVKTDYYKLSDKIIGDYPVEAELMEIFSNSKRMVSSENPVTTALKEADNKIKTKTETICGKPSDSYLESKLNEFCDNSQFDKIKSNYKNNLNQILSSYGINNYKVENTYKEEIDKDYTLEKTNKCCKKYCASYSYQCAKSCYECFRNGYTGCADYPNCDSHYSGEGNYLCYKCAQWVCTKYKYKITYKCTYKIAAKTKFSISTERKYPVLVGDKVENIPIVLNFYVIGSNDDSYQPNFS